MKKNKSVIHKPRKSLGQNFLNDANIVNKIINACTLRLEETVLEIGPGLGALTAKIAPAVKYLHAVEKDKNLYDYLSKNITEKNTTFHCQDFLAYDFSRLTSPVKIIGNLPYNISSPIIEKLIQNREKISDIFIMVQSEFGKRLTAKAGSHDYSALSCVIQYYAESKILFKIKNSCFSPAPKVESCFVKIVFRKPTHPQTANEQLLLRLIKTAFQQRRKQLQNSLASFLPKNDLQKLLEKIGIDPCARAENLSVGDYIKITDAFS